ncbi:MAG TPA: GntR family transcriptional regulator, partial [Gemmatimonadales bacterium]
MKPVSKQSLPDRLARQIRVLIQQGEYRQGDKLPPIMEMARRFRVGHPTVREALKSLETIGLVSIRHGSGVYVN